MAVRYCTLLGEDAHLADEFSRPVRDDVNLIGPAVVFNDLGVPMEQYDQVVALVAIREQNLAIHDAVLSGITSKHRQLRLPEESVTSRGRSACRGSADRDRARGLAAPQSEQPGCPRRARSYRATHWRPLRRASHPQWIRLNRRMAKITVDALRRRQVTDLIILRAHALHAVSCGHLARLAKVTPLRLWLVVHGRRPYAHLVRASRRSVARVQAAMPGAPPLDCLPAVPGFQCHFREQSH
jgi:hypothetical protein